MASLTPPTVSISLTVSDVAQSLELYAKALGVTELFRMSAPDGTPVHAEFMLGNSHMYISCGSAEWQASALPEGQSAPCLFAIESDDPDASYHQAIAGGCESIEEPTDQFWGARTSVVRDPDGYRWNFRKQVEDLTPQEIEARAAKLFGGA